MNVITASFLASALTFSVSAFAAAAKDRPLEIFWTDVEGGAATLIVTPAGESVLIDSGNPGPRDHARIYKTTQAAGITNITYLITTHFHIDHFGGAAELAKLIPIGTVLDNGIPSRDPDGGNNERFAQSIKPYREFKADERKIIHAGDYVPLRQSLVYGAPRISMQCFGAMNSFLERRAGKLNLACSEGKEKDPDTSDNKNSVVLVFRYGSFDFFVGGDLTWNSEAALVCPVNVVGAVDVYQVNHHGLDVSNNPLLVRSLQPSVAIMSNGTRKGCGVETFKTLKEASSITGIFQIHRNLRVDVENNTEPERIANHAEKCDGNLIKLTVHPNGSSYSVSIPATGHQESFVTK